MKNFVFFLSFYSILFIYNEANAQCSATVYAGANQTKCTNNPNVTLSDATVSGETSVLWTSTGTGTFNDPNSLSTVYTPSAYDLTLTVVYLTLEATGTPSCTVIDTLAVFFVSAPVVNAGPDQTVCANYAVVNLNGSSNVLSNIWSGGTGNFAPNSNTINATYVLSAAEIAAGIVTLTLTGNASPCASASDQMTITVTPSPTVNAGQDTSMCANSINLNGIVTVATGGEWTTSGSGSFVPDQLTLNATYVFSAADMVAGSVACTLTTTGNGTCNPVSDVRNITISSGSVTISNAGADQSFCTISSTTLSANSPGGSETGTWSLISGTGTITSPNDPNTNVTGLGTGNNVFAWTISDGTCSSTDDISITVSQPPTLSNAGPDVNICVGNTTLAGNNPIDGTGAWSLVSGSGSIASVNNPNSAVTGLGSGANVFRWTISNGSCTSSSDEVTITVNPDGIIINAGADQSFCGNVSSVSLNGSAINANTPAWTSSGSGIFSDPTVLNADYTPSTADISSGLVTLTLTNSGACDISDNMKIFFHSTIAANAGPDQNITNSTTTLAGNNPSPGSGVWTIVSGSGIISNPVNRNTTVSSIAYGNLTLRWTISNGPCTPTSDDVIISRTSDVTIVNAGPDQYFCGLVNSVQLNGTVIAASGGIWTTNGSGTFSPNASDLNAIYIPSATDSSRYSITFTLTSVGGTGTFEKKDLMYLFLNKKPQAVITTYGTASDYCTSCFTIQVRDVLNKQVTYQWYKNGVPLTGQTGSCYSPQSPGTYHAVLSNNCGTSVSNSIVVPDCFFGLLKGNAFNDINSNGSYDPGEPPLINIVIKVSSSSRSYYVWTDNNGNYMVKVKPNANYQISTYPNFYFNYNYEYWNQTTPTGPNYYSAVIPALGDTIENLDFGMARIPGIRDLSVYLFNNWARPGFYYFNYFKYCNKGSDPVDATIELNYDSDLVYHNSTPAHNIHNAADHSLTWNINNIPPGTCQYISPRFSIPPSTPLGTIIKSVVKISPITGDYYPPDNYDSIVVRVTGSYDPNDKAVYPIGETDANYIRSSDKLDYTIRFQNTGTDTAFTVVVTDTIDADVDLSTFRVIEASHNYYFEIDNDTRAITWTFPNILLPDSNINEPLSHGFIKYKIEQNDNNIDGTVIKNKAAIFFDYNEPVITNETVSRVGDGYFILSTPSPANKNNDYLTIFPNPSKEKISIQSSYTIYGYSITDLTGKILTEGDKSEAINVGFLEKGLYMLKVETSNGIFCKKLIIE